MLIQITMYIHSTYELFDAIKERFCTDDSGGLWPLEDHFLSNHLPLRSFIETDQTFFDLFAKLLDPYF